MKYYFKLFFLFVSFSVFAQPSQKNITEPLPKKAHKFLLVDVRTPAEFEEGHVPNAQNIDWFSVDFNEAFKGVRKRKKIFVYCKSGNRSSKAVARLDSLGFKNVVNLFGGYNAYKAARLE